MNTHPEHIRFEQEKRLQTAITNICEFLCLEMAARHGDSAFHHKVPPDIDTFVSVLQTVIAGIASTIQAASPDSDPPTSDEAPRPDPGLPPSREEQAKSVGRFLELDAESRIRILENTRRDGSIWFSRTEWEVALALFEAGTQGLTLSELAAKVSRWRDFLPSNEAVQRIVSKVTVKFDDAGLPFCAEGARRSVSTLTPSTMPQKQTNSFSNYSTPQHQPSKFQQPQQHHVSKPAQAHHQPSIHSSKPAPMPTACNDHHHSQPQVVVVGQTPKKPTLFEKIVNVFR